MIQRHSLGWEGSVTVDVLKLHTGDNVLKSCMYYGLLPNFTVCQSVVKTIR